MTNRNQLKMRVGNGVVVLNLPKTATSATVAHILAEVAMHLHGLYETEDFKASLATALKTTFPKLAP